MNAVSEQEVVLTVTPAQADAARRAGFVNTKALNKYGPACEALLKAPEVTALVKTLEDIDTKYSGQTNAAFVIVQMAQTQRRAAKAAARAEASAQAEKERAAQMAAHTTTAPDDGEAFKAFCSSHGLTAPSFADYLTWKNAQTAAPTGNSADVARAKARARKASK